MRALIIVSFLLLPYSILAQTTISVLNRIDKKPIKGISVFTEIGSLLGSTNEKGEFIFDQSLYASAKINRLLFYNHDYQAAEFSINEIPQIIYLDKIKSYDLNTVNVTAKRSIDFFILKAYIRSWKLVNNKLVRFGDAIVAYQIPFAGSKDRSRLQDKMFITGIRNFRIDSIKQRSRIINITFNDFFFTGGLPKNAVPNYYTTKKIIDSLYHIYDEGKNVGYYVADENNSPKEIRISHDFEGENQLKLPLWFKLSGKSNSVQKWIGKGETRRPSYLFWNNKQSVTTKIKGQVNIEETVTEIFIDDEISYSYTKPKKYKSFIDKDRSFYQWDFWSAQLQKHPLPSSIMEQLHKVNELKNVY